MASIQQSLNQLLGATAGVATAGSYMYRQSNKYQASQLEKKAERLQEFTEGIDVADTGEAYDESRKLQIEAAKLDPNKKVASHDDFSKKITRAERARELYEEIAEENRANAKRKAEANAVQRQEQKIMTARNMLEALKERKDLLSAKERGQLGTMLGRNKEKGGMDE